MFNDDQIQKLATEYESVFSKYDELMIKYISHSFKSKRGEEFAHHGFLRRLSMLKHCIKTVVTALPPQNSDLPLKDNLNDATMALHAFVINIFGCVDNLSWVLVYELELGCGLNSTITEWQIYAPLLKSLS